MVDAREQFPCRLQEDGSINVTSCADLSKYKEYEKAIIARYLDLYESGPLWFNGSKVLMKHYPPEYGKLSGFNHLMYENYEHSNSELDRMPNLKRMERVAWPKELIEYCHPKCADLLIWENVRKGKHSIVLYCDLLDYVVILGKRSGYLLFITAYPIETDARRRKMLKEYEEYKQTSHPD